MADRGRAARDPRPGPGGALVARRLACSVGLEHELGQGPMKGARAWGFVVVWAAGLPSPPVFADPGGALRHTVIFEEHLGAERRPVSAADSELTRHLLDAGLALVDGAQARKIRSWMDPAAIVSGSASISTVVGPLDA